LIKEQASNPYKKKYHEDKGKVVRRLMQEPRHEDVWVNGDITPYILNLGARWK